MHECRYQLRNHATWITRCIYMVCMVMYCMDVCCKRTILKCGFFVTERVSRIRVWPDSDKPSVNEPFSVLPYCYLKVCFRPSPYFKAHYVSSFQIQKSCLLTLYHCFIAMSKEVIFKIIKCVFNGCIWLVKVISINAYSKFIKITLHDL